MPPGRRNFSLKSARIPAKKLLASGSKSLAAGHIANFQTSPRIVIFNVKNNFAKDNLPKSDPDRALGVHSASNQHNERRYEFYWGYKSHVLVDCISGLPLYELTTPANVSDSSRILASG